MSNHLNGLNLKTQTRELLGFIYITWWCNKEEREKYKNLIQNQKIKKDEIFEQYDMNDIFKNREESNEHYIKNINLGQTSIVTYNKESAFKKILNKILSFFGKQKKGDIN